MSILLFLIAEKSAKVAITLSLIFPGGGQLYTKNYIKAGIFGAAQTYLLYNTYNSIINLKNTEEAYNQNPSDENKTAVDNAILKRNNLLWWDAVVWFIAGADAYVDAKMYDFNSNVSLKFIPNPYKSLITINFHF